jgi:HK97 family phage major capsid protein
MGSKELRAQRADLIMKAKAIVNLDGATDEQLVQADAMLAEAAKLMARVEQIEKADRLSAELNEAFAAQTERAPEAARTAVSRDPAEARAAACAREARIMTAYLRGNVRTLSEDEQGLFASRMGQIVATTNGQSTTNGMGGYTIAPEWSNELMIAMKAFGGMRAVSRIISTDSGASLPFPLLDDTAQSGSIISENTQITQDTDLTFTNATLGSFTYKTGLLTVSLQLLNDSAFDFDSVVRDAMARRLAVKQNTDFTTGAGTTLPFGVVVGAAQGKVGASGQTASMIFDDVVDLVHSVDPAYRAGSRWMMNDSTYAYLVKNLKDQQDRPLFLPGYTVGAPDQLYGYPISINQAMASLGTSNKPVLFGNFSHYIIRDVVGVQMMVLRERFADYLQVGYIAFQRSDGKLVSAASPIKYYQNAAS